MVLVDDTLKETAETMNLLLQRTPGEAVVAVRHTDGTECPENSCTSTITITDNDTPRVTLHLSNNMPFEDDRRVTVTATVSPASPVPFTVEVSATPPSPDGDFTDFLRPAQEDEFSLSTNRTLSFARARPKAPER